MSVPVACSDRPDPSLTFRVCRLPTGTTASDVVKAVRDVVPDDLDWVQCIRRGLYKIAVKTQEAATLLKDRGKINFNGTEVPITLFGRPVMVAVLWYPIEFSDKELIKTLSEYGTVNKVVHTRYREFPSILTGTRKIWMDMHTPVPNFMWIMGCRVLFEYNGIARMCFRCNDTDHSVKDCPIKSAKKCYDCRQVERRTALVPCPRHMAPAGIKLPYPVPDTNDAGTSTSDKVRNEASEVDQVPNDVGAEGSGTESVAEVKQGGNGKGHSKGKGHKKRRHKKKGRR